MREHFVDVIHRLQQRGRHHRRQPHLPPGGQVGALGHDQPRHAQRDDDAHRRLRQDIAQVHQAEESGVLNDDDGQQHQQHHVNAAFLEIGK